MPWVPHKQPWKVTWIYGVEAYKDKWKTVKIEMFYTLEDAVAASTKRHHGSEFPFKELTIQVAENTECWIGGGTWKTVARQKAGGTLEYLNVQNRS